jgi:hypothetical protein
MTTIDGKKSITRNCTIAVAFVKNNCCIPYGSKKVVFVRFQVIVHYSKTWRMIDL